MTVKNMDKKYILGQLLIPALQALYLEHLKREGYISSFSKEEKEKLLKGEIAVPNDKKVEVLNSFEVGEEKFKKDVKRVLWDNGQIETFDGQFDLRSNPIFSSDRKFEILDLTIEKIEEFFTDYYKHQSLTGLSTFETLRDLKNDPALRSKLNGVYGKDLKENILNLNTEKKEDEEDKGEVRDSKVLLNKDIKIKVLVEKYKKEGVSEEEAMILAEENVEYFEIKQIAYESGEEVFVLEGQGGENFEISEKIISETGLKEAEFGAIEEEEMTHSNAFEEGKGTGNALEETHNNALEMQGNALEEERESKAFEEERESKALNEERESKAFEEETHSNASVRAEGKDSGNKNLIAKKGEPSDRENQMLMEDYQRYKKVMEGSGGSENLNQPLNLGIQKNPALEGAIITEVPFENYENYENLGNANQEFIEKSFKNQNRGTVIQPVARIMEEDLNSEEALTKRNLYPGKGRRPDRIGAKRRWAETENEQEKGKENVDPNANIDTTVTASKGDNGSFLWKVGKPLLTGGGILAVLGGGLIMEF